MHKDIYELTQSTTIFFHRFLVPTIFTMHVFLGCFGKAWFSSEINAENKQLNQTFKKRKIGLWDNKLDDIAFNHFDKKSVFFTFIFHILEEKEFCILTAAVHKTSHHEQ